MANPRLQQLAQSGATNGQVARYNSATGVWEPVTPATSSFPYKSGQVLAASFSGNPKTATVTFATPFADANYSPVVASSTSGNTGFGAVVNSKTANGFVINMNVNNITNLISVEWQAAKYGETS